jgi:hypothetical protein
MGRNIAAPFTFTLCLMIPSLSQFRRWSYPSKFAFVSFFISLAVSIGAWLFPDSGKQLVESIFAESQQAVTVPGGTVIEKQINLAKMEGVAASTPSSEFAVAIPFVRPSIVKGADHPASEFNIIGLSNASPLRPENQDIVFAPGRCRFLGSIRQPNQSVMKGEATITAMSCVMDNGDAYEFGKFGGAEIGFVTPIDQPSSNEVLLVEEDRIITLPRSGKYFVRFLVPLRELPYMGKSNVSW